MIKIAPSILSADFSRLGEEICSVSGADYLHFDVMDGVFVPNISIGLPVLKSVRRFTDMALDVHLMITEPEKYALRFAEAGADLVTFHIEASTRDNLTAAAAEVRRAGKMAGIAVKPGTSVEAALPFLQHIDLVLVMTVEPGFGGQKFMDSQLAKIAVLRKVIDELGTPCMIEVDGGINPQTAQLCASAGADILVAGSDIFGASDRTERIELLRLASAQSGRAG